MIVMEFEAHESGHSMEHVLLVRREPQGMENIEVFECQHQEAALNQHRAI